MNKMSALLSSVYSLLVEAAEYSRAWNTPFLVAVFAENTTVLMKRTRRSVK